MGFIGFYTVVEGHSVVETPALAWMFYRHREWLKPVCSTSGPPLITASGAGCLFCPHCLLLPFSLSLFWLPFFSPGGWVAATPYLSRSPHFFLSHNVRIRA